jgi:hypothetical protein
MVEKPYYQAELAKRADIGDTPLKDAINQLGERIADRYEWMFNCTPDDRGYADITLTKWKEDPQLHIRAFDSNGERTFPSIDKRLAQTIFQAGYAPSSFSKLQAVEDEDTVWGWYLFPIEDIRDDGSHVFNTQFVIQK